MTSLPDAPLIVDLFKAIRKGEYEEVQSLLTRGIDPNVKNRTGATPLAAAVIAGHIRILQLLLETGADVHAWGAKSGATLLMRARRGDVARALIAAGLDVNARTSSGTTVLMSQAGSGHSNVVPVLLEQGADPCARDHDGVSALMLACLDDHTEIIDALLTHGAEVGLTEAAMLGDLSTVQTLLSAGLGWRREVLTGALWWVAGRGEVDSLHLLLDAGADIGGKGALTPLMNAVLRGRTGIVEALLSRGADANATDSNGGTAIMFGFHARHGQDLSILQLLLRHGADVNVVSNRGQGPVSFGPTICTSTSFFYGGTPLLLAVVDGKADCVELLLQNGADPNHMTDDADCEGFTALMNAAAVGRDEIVRMLLASGADCNARSSSGRTALMNAAQRNQPFTVRLLLSHGADPGITNNAGQTACDLALQRNRPEIVEILRPLTPVRKD